MQLCRAFLISSTLLLPACDLSDGLKDLGDSLVLPDAALLDAPGRKVRDGTYRNLILDGSLEKGGYVMAFRTDTKKERLAIAPFLEGSGCEIEDVIAVERVSSKIDVALPGLVAVQTQAGEETELHFVGFDCKDRLEVLPNTSPPRLLFPLVDPLGALTVTGSGELYFVEPKTPKLTKVRTGVTSGQATQERLFVAVGDKIEVLDKDFETVATLGDGVTNYLAIGGPRVELLYTDATGLHQWSEKNGDELLAADGCNPTVSDSDPSVIAYFSPCSTRRLVVEVSGAQVGSAEPRVRFLGPEGVALNQGMLDKVAASPESTFAVVRTQPPEARTGELLLLRGRAPKDGETEVELSEPEVLGTDLSIHLNAVYKGYDGIKGELFTYTAPSKAGGDPLLVSIAPGVGAIFGSSLVAQSGLLAKYNGELGELWSFADSPNLTKPEPKLLGKRVPRQYVVTTEQATETAFVGEVRDGVGDFFLVRKNVAKSVAEKVLPDTLRYLSQPKAVAYLRTTRSGSVRLSAYLLESDLTADISDNVNEYRGVPWPSPGILYATSGGDDDGLWFAKAR